jgi:hypothetical protein
MPQALNSLSGIINSLYFSLFFGSILNGFAAFRLATLINPSQEKQRTLSIPFFVTGTLVMLSRLFHLAFKESGENFWVVFLICFGASLLSWLLLPLKNLMEYFLILPSFAVFLSAYFVFYVVSESIISENVLAVMFFVFILLSIVLPCVFISLRKRFLITYKIIYACVVSLSCSAFGICWSQFLEKIPMICFLIVSVVYTVFIAILGIISAKKMESKENISA